MGSKYKEGKSKIIDLKKSEARSFEFPERVKQIGGISFGKKVYIEDYAHSYISKIKNGEDGDTALFLIGYTAEELGERIVVIKGAVQPPFLQKAKDGQAFSEEDKQYAAEKIEKFFPEMQIVGWARIQPNFGLYLSSQDISSHYLGFTDKDDILFLVDPDEKMDCFFAWNEKQDDLEELNGYYIYYEKNQEMIDYIEHAKNESAEILKEAEEKKEDVEYIPTEPEKQLEAKETEPKKEKEPDQSVKNAKRLAEISRQKRIISMMSSISALLFFACIIMGIGLLQSGERISIVEKQIEDLKSGYTNLVSKVNDSATPTFAAQTEPQESTALTGDITEDINRLLTENLGTDASSEAALPTAIEQPQAEEMSAQQRPFQEQTAETEETQAVQAPAQSAATAETTETATEEEQGEKQTYVVKKGDTIAHISLKYYGDYSGVDLIMDSNGITDPTTLKIGKVLIIPDK